MKVLLIKIKMTGPFVGGLKYLPWLIVQPIKYRHELFAEFKEWKKKGILDTKFHQLMYVLDHLVFWIFYCLIATIKGDVRGYSYYTKDIPVNLRTVGVRK